MIRTSSPGKVYLSSPGKAYLLSGASGGGGGGGAYTGSLPTAIPGLSAWFDAGAAPAAGYMVPVTSLADLSGAGRSLTIAGSAGGSGNLVSRGAMIYRRLNGMLGGLRAEQVSSLYSISVRYPFIDPLATFSVSAVPMGAAQSWTRYMVWSRPLRGQVDYTGPYLSTPLPLLTGHGVPILTVTNTGTNDQLVLFPGTASQTALASNLTEHHSHSITLRNTAGAGVDVWLDDAQVATAVAVPAALAGTVTDILYVLGSATASGRCDLHELALWESALTAPGIVTLLTSATSVSKRWSNAALGTIRGPRKAFGIGIIGQSGAVYAKGAGLPFNGGVNLCENARISLGALSAYLIGDGWSQATAGAMLASGTALYGTGGGWLVSDGGNNPATWTLGTMGTAFQTWATDAAANHPEVLADLSGIVWWYSENDGQRAYSEKALFQAVAAEVFRRIRSMTGKTAAQLPIMMIDPLPYAVGNTLQTGYGYGLGEFMREAVASLVATPGLGVFQCLTQSADAIGMGATYQSITGSWTGGDNAHVDLADNATFGLRAGVAVAATLVGLGLSENFSSTPPGMPTGGGPKITTAKLESATSVLVTLQHDNGSGTDIITPLLATTGTGWTVMDGGTTAAPGTPIDAVNCARVGPTQVRLTLASPVSGPGVATPSTCLLFYPGPGFRKLGRGDAVTDNQAAVGGAPWAPNFPVAATIGVPLSP